MLVSASRLLNFWLAKPKLGIRIGPKLASLVVPEKAGLMKLLLLQLLSQLSCLETPP
jgi:hypothetical protein